MDVSAILAKVKAMSDQEKESRIDEIYAMPEPLPDEISLEFSAIMLGGVDDPEAPTCGAPCPYEIDLTEAECEALDASLAAKVAAMNPAERVERRRQILSAAPSFAGDTEFCKLLMYDEQGNPW